MRAAGIAAQRCHRAAGRLGYEAHELDPGTLSMTETEKQGRDC
jgi:P-type Cu2+ transporter